MNHGFTHGPESRITHRSENRNAHCLESRNAHFSCPVFSERSGKNGETKNVQESLNNEKSMAPRGRLMESVS